MKRSGRNLSVFILIGALILAGAYRLSFQGEGGTSKKSGGSVQAVEKGPVALVKTAPIRSGTIAESITVYGVTIPAPGALKTVSLPFESQVRKVMVNDGQEVSPGDLLLEIEPSPDTALRLEQARNSDESTKQSLAHIQRLFDLKLATNDQLLQAKQAFEQARLVLQSMKERNIGGPRKIPAGVAGLVNKISVQEGVIVPAGGALLEIVVQKRLEVRLGIEPEDINRVRPNQEVSLRRVNAPTSREMTGRIRKISGAVNPNTRLIDGFVTLPSSSLFLLGERLAGKITVASSEGLIVPRSAVLPEETRHVIFTIKNERAVKQIVQVGLENEKEVEVFGGEIRPGDPAVVLGNYELEDGMAVRVETSK